MQRNRKEGNGRERKGRGSKSVKKRTQVGGAVGGAVGLRGGCR